MVQYWRLSNFDKKETINSWNLDSWQEFYEVAGAPAAAFVRFLYAIQ